jgi:hypothetical protein
VENDTHKETDIVDNAVQNDDIHSQVITRNIDKRFVFGIHATGGTHRRGGAKGI